MYLYILIYTYIYLYILIYTYIYLYILIYTYIIYTYTQLFIYTMLILFLLAMLNCQKVRERPGGLVAFDLQQGRPARAVTGSSWDQGTKSHFFCGKIHNNYGK